METIKFKEVKEIIDELFESIPTGCTCGQCDVSGELEAKEDLKKELIHIISEVSNIVEAIHITRILADICRLVPKEKEQRIVKDLVRDKVLPYLNRSWVESKILNAVIKNN